jgi:hypothetical protein
MLRILPLFAALSELLVSGKSSAEVAADFQIDLDELTRAAKIARGNLWKGHLARALQSPDQRPELLTHFSTLAGLEHHYGLLMAQWQRAEETCRQVRALKDPDIVLQMKADAFSFRIEQAAARIFRDIQKAEAQLQKIIATPYLSFVAEKDESLHSKKNPPQTQPAPQVIHPPANPVSASQKHWASALPPVAAEPPVQPQNELLQKHRQRIKNTPAKDRPALIARLMEQGRPKELVA